VLSSTDTGADNAVTIVQNDTSLNLSTNSIGTAAAASGNAFSGSITASGAYTGTAGKNIVMQITTAGGIGTAKYKVSTDGGVTWSADDAFTTSTSNVDVTGAAAQGVNVNFTDSSTPAAFAVGDRFTLSTYVPELQKAQNAVVSVNGVQVSRATNTFDDVIPGVTLNARKSIARPKRSRSPTAAAAC